MVKRAQIDLIELMPLVALMFCRIYCDVFADRHGGVRTFRTCMQLSNNATFPQKGERKRENLAGMRSKAQNTSVAHVYLSDQDYY